MSKKPTLLSEFRALEVGDETSAFCGKILADMGVDVIRLESPGGDTIRNIGPFYHNITDPEKSLFWFAYGSNKRSIIVDVETKEGQETFRKLVTTADFVIESFPRGYLHELRLGYSTLSEINPRLIMTSITPFGQTGPYKDYKASDITAMAMGGLMHLTGDPDRPPVRITCPQSFLVAGAEAAAGTMVAHYYRELSGEGQHVDVSIQESVCETLMFAPLFPEFLNLHERRIGSFRRGLGGGGHRLQQLFWPCKDGYVTYNILGGAVGAPVNRALLAWMDSEQAAPDFFKEVNWDILNIAETTDEQLDKLMEPVGEFFLKYTKAELHEEASRRGIMLYPVFSSKDVVEDAQLKSRGFWVDVEHPELGTTITYPEAPVKFTETPITIRHRAPLIGEHNNEIYLEERTPYHVVAHSSESKRSKKPFEGVRVADFSWVAAGPWITKYLAQHGAEVIRIESSTRLDQTRGIAPFKDNIPGPNRAAQFAKYNNDKYGITLNLKQPRGIEIAKEIVARSDIVVENFAPGVMKRWGLDYEELRKVKPDIIMLSSSHQGQTGPHALQGGFGWHLTSLPGFIHLTGWPDRPPSAIYSPYTDVIGARYGVFSLIAALDYRRRTGTGQYIDLSQYEASVFFLSLHILNYTTNGQVADRAGNRSPCAAPHGAYPCLGEDRWCAIAVFIDEEWQNFCKAIGNLPWTNEPKFSTLRARKENEDELDSLVAQWTSTMSAEQVMTVLQAAGVAAGVVRTVEELFHDPQLIHRSHFIELQHFELGKHKYEQPAYRLSKTPAKLHRAAPCLGQDNEYVYCELLGIPDDEFVELMAAHVFD